MTSEKLRQLVVSLRSIFLDFANTIGKGALANSAPEVKWANVFLQPLLKLAEGLQIVDVVTYRAAGAIEHRSS